jgi:hypothetical protein
MATRGLQMLFFDVRSVLNGEQVYQGERLFEVYEEEEA